MVGGYTVVPEPFWGGVLFPTIVFGVLYLWPWIEERLITRDTSRHELLDRPRDNPGRTAVGAAFFAWVVTIFAAGAADRAFLSVGIPYITQVWIFRGAIFVVPVVVFVVARRIARGLAAAEAHPLRGWTGEVVERREVGGYTAVTDGRDPSLHEPPARPRA